MSLPLGHFRKAIAALQITPELGAIAFAGTSIRFEDLGDAKLKLSGEDFFTMLDNIGRVLDPAWFLALPMLWSAEVQGDFEMAMRCAPTLFDSMMVAERFGNNRWPIGRWEVEHVSDGARFHLLPTIPSSDYAWHCFRQLVTLNFQSILETAFPEAIPRLVIHSAYDPGTARGTYERAIKCRVDWSSGANYTFVPADVMTMPSALADARVFAILTAGLEAEQSAAPSGILARALAHLKANDHGRLSAPSVAAHLGLSLRSFERALSAEGTSFRALLDASLKKRLEVLLRDPQHSLANIAEQLGYSDETALSRATKRLLGQPPRLARQKLQGS